MLTYLSKSGKGLWFEFKLKDLFVWMFRKNFIIFFVAYFFILTGICMAEVYSDNFFTSLSDKIDIAQKDCEGFYKDLLEQDYLPKDSDLGLEARRDISNSIIRNSTLLLNLINWLDKNGESDPIGFLFLRKLNRYLYLQFRSFVGQLKMDKKDEGHLVGLLHDIYKFKVPADIGLSEAKLKYSYPFQNTLSKAILSILILNASDLEYKKKVGSVAYFLDKIRRDLLDIRSQHESCGLTTEDFDDFIELLQAYSTKEPVVGQNNFKFLLITLTIAGVIILVVWLACDKDSRDFISSRCKNTWAFILRCVEDLGEAFGRGSARGFLTEARDAEVRLFPGVPLVPREVSSRQGWIEWGKSWIPGLGR